MITLERLRIYFLTNSTLLEGEDKAGATNGKEIKVEILIDGLACGDRVFFLLYFVVVKLCLLVSCGF